MNHETRAKTSCSAPTNSRSPSQHRSRSVSAQLRQASVMSGDPAGSGLTIGPNAWLKVRNSVWCRGLVGLKSVLQVSILFHRLQD